MKKQLLSAVLVAAVAFTACKKNKNEQDPFKLNYSNLTTEQQKQQIEQSGTNLMNKLDALPSEKSVSALSHLADLQLPVGTASAPLSTLLTVGNAATHKDTKAMFRATTSSVGSSVQAISDSFGIYTWNAAAGDWEEAPATDRMEIRFPAMATSTTNNAVLVITYQKSNVTKDGAELPASISATLSVDNKEELKFTSLGEYQSDGTPTKVDMTLQLGAYAFKTNFKNDASTASASFSFDKSNEVLFSFSNTVKGENISLTHLEDNPGAIITEANTSLKIVNIEIAGVVNYKGISDEEKGWSSLSEAERSDREAAAWNKYSKLVAINRTDNTIIAKNEFVSVEEPYTYCYWNGSTTVCNTETDYSMEPRLVFKDGSKMSIGQFFEHGFDALIDDVTEFSDRFN